MHAEDFIIDTGSYGEAIETLSKSFPKFDTVPSFALIIETVDLINRSTLMVASKQEEIFRVLDFISE